MRQFTLHGLAFLCLQLGLLAVFEVTFPVDEGVFEAVALDKEARLRSTPAPRLVLVGGSNVAFGYDCGVLADALPGYEPVNMGVNAGFGLDAILAEALEGLRDGDVVVVSPEYGHFVELRAEVALFELLQVHPAAVRFLGPQYVKPVLDQAAIFFGRQLQRRLLALRGDDVARSLPYRRSAVDHYGDVVGHADLEPAHGVDAPVALPLSGRSVAYAVDSLTAFAAAAEARGVRVAVEFPPIPERTMADWQVEVDTVHAALRGSGLVLLNAPVSWPVERFFDTRYHLRRPSARLRAETLAPRLKAWLGP